MPREVALKILHKIDKDGAYTNIAVKDGLAASGLDARDKGFVSEMVYGIVSRRLTLDYFIKKYSSVKLKKLSLYVLELLRMGIYQIYFMDRVPESAAVNESVKLAKRYAGRSAGFVNAVLRSIIRGGDSISDIQSIMERYSFPDSIYNVFKRDFGEQRAIDIMKSLNEKPHMTLRANTLKVTADELLRLLEHDGITAEPGDAAASVFVSGMDVGGSRLYRDGFFTVQGTAAMLSCAALGVKPGMSVIDMCAAPGGKTTYLCELMKNSGSVRAFDIYDHKIELIRQNAKRLGITIIDASVSDAAVIKEELFESADRVMADVPCSGLGIIAKKPDIKWAFEESSLPGLQLKILENAAMYLKHGGSLIYSTCTLNKQENECVVEKFLSQNTEFEPEDFGGLIPKRFSCSGRGYITLYPDTDRTDGFFIAKIKRR